MGLLTPEVLQHECTGNKSHSWCLKKCWSRSQVVRLTVKPALKYHVILCVDLKKEVNGKAKFTAQGLLAPEVDPQPQDCHNIWL